jgi:hypothetical protein
MAIYWFWRSIPILNISKVIKGAMSSSLSKIGSLYLNAKEAVATVTTCTTLYEEGVNLHQVCCASR